ncbi:MAG: hypothetical protein Q9O24_02725 [Gammaproteobacteria bacterium]|nr:hypothetical protein [Gammaproteobacteria bacterium]
MTLYKQSILLLFLAPPTSLLAQSHLQLETGLTLNDNSLPTQQNNLTNSADQTRLGVQLSLAGHWQKLNKDGGLSASLYADQDRALEKKNADLRQLTLQGQTLLALSPHWLSRTQLNANHYTHQQQPANSYQSLSLDQTWGYFADSGSGLDLNLALQQRRYNQNPSGSYEGQRYQLSSVYYFAAPSNRARWAAAITLQQFNASTPFYNSKQQQLSLSYGQWQWYKLQGNLSLQWLKNRYPNTQEQLNDTYQLLTVDAQYPLASQWHLSGSLTTGRYQPSNTTANTLLNAALALRLSF